MRRFLNLFPARRSRMEHHLDREIRYHLERRIDELTATGLSAAEALRQAQIEFGGVLQVQEEVRDAWLARWVQDCGRDIRYASRLLWASPGFAATAVLSLALGIGANTAIFSILHALILRSLPVADPQSLVLVSRNETVSSPYPLFTELRDHSQALAGVVAFRNTPLRLSRGGDTERVTGTLVSGTYFDVLGVRPMMGTAIEREDDEIPGSGGARGPLAVLSHRFWRRSFGGQASAVGASIQLNGQPFTVAGVAPPGFEGMEVGEPSDVFVPMMLQEALLPGLGKALEQPRNQWLRIFGRLSPARSRAQAEAELTTLLRRYNEVSFGLSSMRNEVRRRNLLNQRIVLVPGDNGISQLRRQYSKPLWVLIAVVALVLLIACANVANLLLSRAAARRREIAIRLSLGAARSRLIRQLFTESALLALAGAGSGLLLARWMRDALIRYLPSDRSLDAPMAPMVLLFTMALGVASALFFGLIPAFQSTRVDVTPAIKGADSAGPSRNLFRKGLVVVQMSLSLLLLIGAALFLQSLHNLITVDPGFVRENILLATVESPPGLQSRLLQEVRSLSGVSAAALADSPPLGNHTGWDIFAEGYTPKGAEPRDSPSVSLVSSAYFKTMGIPLLLGHDFDDRDVAAARNVMVVNETFARHYFGDLNPIGRRVGTKEGTFDWEIVGVVRNGKYAGLREEPLRVVYVPSRPGPWASHSVIHLRSASSPAVLAPALRQKLRELDKNATLFDIHTVQEEIDRSLLRERLLGMITGLFGALALVLAAIGLYGLVAYGVSRRTRDFGIRIAIGAKAGSIVRLVVGEAVWLLAAGTAVGLTAAWMLGKLVRSMLFGIEPADAMSIALAVAVLLLTALLAAWIPARRASRVDPNCALRWE